MADGVVIGLEELTAALLEVPAKIEANMLRGGLRQTAIQIQTEAKQLCPDSPPNEENAKLYGGYQGQLRDSIRVTTGLKNGTAYAKVIAGKKKSSKIGPYYAHFVEFGTASHWIKPLNRKSLSVAGQMFAMIKHPGAQKKPFMRPAMDSKAQAGLQAMADYMIDRMPKELAKL